jgi:sugar phosphate isomerase/epimerase
MPLDQCLSEAKSAGFEAVLRQLGDYAGWLVVESEQDPEKRHRPSMQRPGAAI